MSTVVEEQGLDARKTWTVPELEQIEMRRTQQVKFSAQTPECPATPFGLNPPAQPIVCSFLS